MLILSRKVGEKIELSNGVTIVPTRISKDGNRVRLGIRAPAGVKIAREELLDHEGFANFNVEFTDDDEEHAPSIVARVAS